MHKKTCLMTRFSFFPIASSFCIVVIIKDGKNDSNISNNNNGVMIKLFF